MGGAFGFNASTYPLIAAGVAIRVLYIVADVLVLVRTVLVLRPGHISCVHAEQVPW